MNAAPLCRKPGANSRAASTACGPRPALPTTRPPGRLAAAVLARLALGLLALGLGAGRAAAPGPETVAALRERIWAHVTQPRFARAHWGIHLVSLETGRVLFTANADKWFVPASTTKLFTGALALDVLGPDFRIRTSLYAAARPDAHGTLRGDLRLYGRGDPGFLVGAAGGDWDRALAPLVEAAVRAGLKQVQGGLVADASYFRGPAVGSGWEYDDLTWYYGAEVSALSLNNNALEVVARPAARAGLPAEVFLYPSTAFVSVSNRLLTVAAGGPRRVSLWREPRANVVHVRGTLPLDAGRVSETVAVREPARWFGEEFKRALGRRGISVRGPVRVLEATPESAGAAAAREWLELGGCDSAPLRELLPRMLKPSQNLHAQLWFLQAGATLAPAGPDETSEQAGRRAMNAFLARAGIPAGEVRLEEGSGLSRHNVVTPRALVRLLEFMTRHPHAEVFRAALPVAGVDGTLRLRLRGTPAEGNLRAKTGSLDLVNALAGYVTSAAGEPLVFALLLNQYAGGERPGRAELDEIAAWLAGLRQHSREWRE
jgi:D-alanyl-D-alanine carboxypeptidase/D-alanyl-D-alanine-endopeptidase (penicillin-binding protein 4)